MVTQAKQAVLLMDHNTSKEVKIMWNVGFSLKFLIGSACSFVTITLLSDLRNISSTQQEDIFSRSSRYLHIRFKLHMGFIVKNKLKMIKRYTKVSVHRSGIN